MEKLRVGIVGAGSIAHAHLNAYQQFADRCEVVAVADVFVEKAQEFAQQIGDSVRAYGDHREMLANEDIDLVSVCTPPFNHAPIAIDALQAGKHVWGEKPIAASLAECDQMIAAAERAGRVLAGVFQNRYRPEFQKAKHLLSSGAMGRLVLAKSDCLWWRGRSYYDLWWRGTWDKECGGVTINHAVHIIDAMLWLAGERVVSVYAEMDTYTHDVEVEDLSCAILRFESGAMASLVNTVCAHQNADRIEITCEHADLTLPALNIFAMRGFPNGFGEPDTQRIAELRAIADTAPVSPYGGHAAQLQDVLDAIQTGRQPEVSGAEARKSLEVITAIYKSASTGQRVNLPLSPNDPFYTTEGLRANVKRHPAPPKTQKG